VYILINYILQNLNPGYMNLPLYILYIK